MCYTFLKKIFTISVKNLAGGFVCFYNDIDMLWCDRFWQICLISKQWSLSVVKHWSRYKGWMIQLIFITAKMMLNDLLNCKQNNGNIISLWIMYTLSKRVSITKLDKQIIRVPIIHIKEIKTNDIYIQDI